MRMNFYEPEHKYKSGYDLYLVIYGSLLQKLKKNAIVESFIKYLSNYIN